MKQFLSLSVFDGLKLTTLQEDDAPALFALVNSNRYHLRRYLNWIDSAASVNDSIQFIRSTKTEAENGISLVLGIFFQEELIGVISFHSINNFNRNASVGYWIVKNFEGKGLVTASLDRLIKYGFEEMNLNRIAIHCSTENERSRAIAKRLGFQKEGVLRQMEWMYNRFLDAEVWSLLLEEWKNQKVQQSKSEQEV